MTQNTASPDEPDYEALAEQAYDEMYDSRSPAGCYNDLKYYFARAIAAAEAAGRTDDAARLTTRLQHCIAVYRSQFWVSGSGGTGWNFSCPVCDAGLLRFGGREDTDGAAVCPHCGWPLPAEDRYRLVHPGRRLARRYRIVRFLRAHAWVVRAGETLRPAVPALLTVLMSFSFIAFLKEPGIGRILAGGAAALAAGLVTVILTVTAD